MAPRPAAETVEIASTGSGAWWRMAPEWPQKVKAISLAHSRGERAPLKAERSAALARCRAARQMQSAAVCILIEQPAATLLGLRAKAQAAVAWYGNEPPHGGPGESILWSMAEDASRDFDPAAGAASP